ncbi:MAG: RNA 3'-terminal phosphate cyclase [Desulfomonilaceae bacterium]|nr:RNA 3'-terminal phosphate cyclase [Desulfomonilaceae bacterium]
MLEIDGSMHSGSGTLLRYAVALAVLKRRTLHITRIRSKRPKPGLRAQHLNAVKACAMISNGRLQGAEVGSQELFFEPGPVITGGRHFFDIGTAGSATMAAFTLIGPALFASEASTFTITGGLFQDFAPSFHHMRHVLVPLLRRMGAEIDMTMIRPGYVPRGGGKLTLHVKPCAGLTPLVLDRQGTVRRVHGIALASHLEKQRVSRRMASRSRELLRENGYACEVESVNDNTAVQTGAALVIWATTDTGCLLGADRAGKPGRRSEAIAEFVVRSLLEDIESGASTDRWLADQLILFAALAAGTTEYAIPRATDHVESNLWLVRELLGARAELHGNRVIVEGIGLS